MERKLLLMDRYKQNVLFCMTGGCTLALVFSIFAILYIQNALAFAPSGPPSTQTPSSPSSESPSESTAPFMTAPSSDSSDEDNNSNFLKYKNSTYGVKIQYPADWETYTQADAMYSAGKYIIGFNSPDKTTGLNIEIEDSPQDLKEYAQRYNDLQNIQIINSESGPTNLNGNPAYELVYTSNSQDTKIKHLFEKVGDRLYFITYASSTGKYSDYFPIAQKMIDSLELK